jgi:hypothetical protein
MKKLRQFEIDHICDEAYNLIKEEKTKQVQREFDKSDEKEQLLEIMPQLNQLQSKIEALKKEESILLEKEYELKKSLIDKGVCFNRTKNEKYDISLASIHSIYCDIRHEIILNGIDDGNNVREFIKELVDKFK